MKLSPLYLLILIVSFSSCIGDDFIDDFVEPVIRITNAIDTLAVGETYQLEAQFFNNVGQQIESEILWASSDEEVAIVSDEGLLWGRQKGDALITASVDYEGEVLSISRSIAIDEETVATPTFRNGTLRTTSSYNLRGGFELTTIEGGVRLSFDEDYFTDDVLPGLYIYLTNNPNTVRDAHVIQEVEIFKGEHSYDVLDVGLNDFSHVLYFCKPFNVKVGDGAFE